MVIDLKTKSPVPTDTYDGHFGRVDGRRHAGRDLLVPLSCAERRCQQRTKERGISILSSPSGCYTHARSDTPSRQSLVSTQAECTHSGRSLLTYGPSWALGEGPDRLPLPLSCPHRTLPKLHHPHRPWIRPPHPLAIFPTASSTRTLGLAFQSAV